MINELEIGHRKIPKDRTTVNELGRKLKEITESVKNINIKVELTYRPILT